LFGQNLAVRCKAKWWLRCKLLSTECIRLYSVLFLFVDCLYSATLLCFCSSTACICLLCLHFVSLSVRRFRFVLNEHFAANYYRLNAFGYSALFLFVDCLSRCIKSMSIKSITIRFWSCAEHEHPHEPSFPEVLNESADELATIARKAPIRTQQDDDHWPEQTVSIIGARTCGRLADALHYCCTASDLISY
jgi:hypothetical protein